MTSACGHVLSALDGDRADASSGASVRVFRWDHGNVANSGEHQPFFHRGPLPDKHQVEVELAEIVEAAVRLHDGRELGRRERRDAKGGDLRVDFTYDGANPAVAMEISRPANEAVAALGSELLKLEAHLQGVVQAEGLGTWLLAVETGTRRSAIADPLIELIRSERARTGVLLSRDDLPRDLDDTERRRLAALFDLGLFSALRLEAGNEVHIHPPVSGTQEELDLSALLSTAMSDNVTKLHEAAYPESHLVVAVDRHIVSADPARTPPPQLPDGVDVLWVFLGYFNAKWTHRLWRTAGDGSWVLLQDPFGNPPTRYPAPA